MNLVQQLTRDEGYKLNAYKDSLGLWTIGVGHLIDPSKGAHPPAFMTMPNGVIDDKCSITNDQCDTLLISDIAAHTAKLERALPWVAQMGDEVRQSTKMQRRKSSIADGRGTLGTPGAYVPGGTDAETGEEIWDEVDAPVVWPGYHCELYTDAMPEPLEPYAVTP